MFGVVLGVIEVSIVGFLLSWAFSISRATILVTIGILLTVNSIIAVRRRSVLTADYESLLIRSKRKWNDPLSPKVPIFLLVSSTLLTTRIMQIAYDGTDSGGVAVSHLSVYGDWSAHLAYAASFAYSNNFPLNYQLLPGRVSPTTSGLIGSPPCLFRWDLISFPPCKHQPCFSPLSFLQFSSSGTKGLLQITARLYCAPHIPVIRRHSSVL